MLDNLGTWKRFKFLSSVVYLFLQNHVNVNVLIEAPEVLNC